MAIALVGDTHFGRKAEHPTIKQCINDGQAAFFDWLETDLRSRGVKTILFTGDIFDTRNTINVEALIKTIRLFKKKFAAYECIIVLGNHDMYYENSYDICSTEVLDELKNVTVIRSGNSSLDISQLDLIPNHNFYIVPWIIQDKLPEFTQFLTKIEANRDTNILFGHFEMMGVDMEGGNLSTFGLSPNLFTASAKYILSGHYHGKSDQIIDGSMIRYLGSPYPLTFANSDSDHGYWLLNNDMSMEFIKNDISPKFTTLFDTDDLSALGDLSNTFVRLYMNNSKTKEEIFNIRSIIESKKPLLLRVISYKDGSIETNKTPSQRDANKLLSMDLFSLTEIYIDSNSDSLPIISVTHTDAKQAIMERIRGYHEKATLKK